MGGTGMTVEIGLYENRILQIYIVVNR